MEKERNISLDLLRILSCFLVIIIHVSAQNIYLSDPQTGDWQVMNFLNTAALTGPALFIMISGALMLPGSYHLNLKQLYTKKILRLVAAYLFWLVIYNAIPFIQHYSLSWENVKLYLLEILYGNGTYHLWFLPMLTGLYMILPFLRAIVHHKPDLTAYFIILFFIIQFIFPTILKFDFPYRRVVESLYSRIPFSLIIGYAGFMILGYYLSSAALSRFTRHLFYIGGTVATLAAVIIDSLLSIQAENANLALNDLFTVHIFLLSGMIFLLFQKQFQHKHQAYPARLRKIIRAVSKCTFGIYLIHVLIMNWIVEHILPVEAMPAIISIPLISLLTFGGSLLITYALSRIPLAGKYIT